MRWRMKSFLGSFFYGMRAFIELAPTAVIGSGCADEWRGAPDEAVDQGCHALWDSAGGFGTRMCDGSDIA